MKKIVIPIILLFLLVCDFFAASYKITLIPEKKKIYLGDKVNFLLKIESDEDIKSFKIISKNYKFKLIEKKNHRIIYRFSIQFFKTGIVEIPQIEVSVNNLKLCSNSLKLRILSNLKKDSKFYDVKPPEEVSFYLTKREKLILIAIILFLIIIGFILYKLLKRKDVEIKPEKFEFDYMLPFEEAKKNIKICESYLEKGDLQNFYAHLSYTLRRFLDRKKKLNTVDLTVEEIFQKYGDSIDMKILNNLKEWDEIRFSGNFPDYETMKIHLEKLNEIIENVENS